MPARPIAIANRHPRLRFDRRKLAAVVAALDTQQTVRRAYNLAGAQPIRFADLITTAARAMHRNVLLLSVPLEAAVIAARLTRVVTPEQVRKIAETKLNDLNARDLDHACRIIAGTARSMGIDVKG